VAFVDQGPDLYLESGSGSRGNKMKKKSYFLVIFFIFIAIRYKIVPVWPITILYRYF
jgi:hypothetical protein